MNDFDILEDFVNEKSGGGLFLNLTEEGSYNVRLLTQEGLYLRGKENRFCTQEVSFVIGAGETRKKLVSPATFGEDDPFDKEIKPNANKDVRAIIGNYKIFNRRETFMFPCLLVKLDKSDPNNSTYEGFRILCANKILAAEIAKEINHYQDLGEDSLADLKKGYNLKIIRKGKQLNTEWTVKAWRNSTKVRKEDLTDVKQIADILDEQYIAYDDLLEELEDYLQGDALEMLDELGPGKKGKSKRERRESVPEPKTSRRRQPEPDDDDDEEEEKEPVRGRKTKPEPEPEPVKSRRRLPEPDEDDDDDEVIPVVTRGRTETPTANAKTSRRLPDPDEDDEDEEQEEQPRRGRGRPPREAVAEPVKPKAGKKVIEDEPDDEPRRGRGRPAGSTKKAAEEPTKKNKGPVRRQLR